MSSELGQDLWVLERLGGKRNGLFVDVGAHDGVFASNTLRLEQDYGWTGICIEANPRLATKCRENRKCEVIQAAVHSVANLCMDFYDADNLGGLVQFAFSDLHASKRAQAPCIQVHTITLNEILSSGVDYLSVDIEGAEFEALRVLDFSRFVPRLLTIEHNFGPQREALRYLLSSQGYKCKPVAHDDWWERKDS